MGIYWSFWVEVQFYAVASTLFSGQDPFHAEPALDHHRHQRHQIYPPVFMRIVSFGSRHHPGLVPYVMGLKTFYNKFNIIYFLPWFVLGAFFHYLFKGYRLLSNKRLDISMLVVLCFPLCRPLCLQGSGPACAGPVILRTADLQKRVAGLPRLPYLSTDRRHLLYPLPDSRNAWRPADDEDRSASTGTLSCRW